MEIRAVALAAALALASAPSRPAIADEDPGKSACVHAYESAQKQRMAGDLPAAKAELLVCSREACPAIVRTDCVGWLREVETAMPSILVTVRDLGGNDVRTAKVFVDGAPLAHPAGEAFELRPGPRKLRVEVPGAAPIDREIVVASGEKSRVVALVVGLPGLAGAEPRPAPPFPRGATVLGVIGAAFVVGGVSLEAAGTVRLHDLHTGCAPNCAPARIDSTRAEIIVGDVLLGAGVATLAAATIYYLTHRSPEPLDARGRAGAFGSPLAVAF